MCPTFKLYVPFFLAVVAFDRYKRDAKLEIVDWPIAEIRYVIHVLLFNGIISK